MAENRKKRKINVKAPKSKPKQRVNTEGASDNVERKSALTVVNGKRKRNKIIRFVSLSLAVAVVITLFIINYCLPTGLVESLQNYYASSGIGTYPVNVYASNSNYFGTKNDIICTLNGSFFELYNKNGKLLQAVSHGMSKPLLEESEARYLLYDRDRYKILIYNYSGLLYQNQFEKSIVSADICRSGSYAVVTASDSFQNTVTVYNKDNEVEYSWNSANFYVTDTALSDDGKQLAVSLLESKDGSFNSYVYILSFDSADPKYKYTFSDVVSSLSSVGENYILANGFDRVYTIPWSGGAERDLNINGMIRCYDYDFSGKSCIVYGREDNEQINSVVILDDFGNATASFKFNNVVSDIAVSETEVAVLSNNTVYLYDLSGNSLATENTELKGMFVGLISDGRTVVLDNSKLVLVK